MKAVWLRTIVCLSIWGAATPTVAADSKPIKIGTRVLPDERGDPFVGLNLPWTLPLQAIFDALTAIGPNGEVVPRLATEWIAETPRTWVFKLRRNVSFSNGEPFTAAAVVAAIDYLLSPQGKVGSVGTQLALWGVTGAQARDDYTVVITTSATDTILPLHASWLRIPAPKAWATMPRTEFVRAPVGTGPFTATQWEPNRIVLASAKGSWRAPSAPSMELLAIPDQAARVQALNAGSVDVALELTPDERMSIEERGGRLQVYLRPDIEFLAFVTVKDSPVKDVRVRRALNYAVNKERIIAGLLDGATKPAAQVAHPQSFGFADRLQPYPYDVEQAKRLLREAGYADGFELPALIVGGANNADDVYQQIASDLAAVKVKMTLKRATYPAFMDYMYRGGWPSLAFAMSTTGYDPLDGYRIRSCTWHHPYHCDPAIVPLITRARQAGSPDSRRTLVQDVLTYERDNPPWIMLWQTPSWIGIGKRIADFAIVGDAVQFDHIRVRN